MRPAAHTCHSFSPVQNGTGPVSSQNPVQEVCDVEPAFERYRPVRAVAGGARGAGDDGGARRGKAQHGLGRRMHARAALPRSAAAPSATSCSGIIRWSGCNTRPFWLLTAGAAFATILIARLVHRLNTAFLVLDAIGLVVFTMAGCDVARQIDPSSPLHDRGGGGDDHGLRRRRAARHPLQRRAAAVSRRTLRQRLHRHRAVLLHRIRAGAQSRRYGPR